MISKLAPLLNKLSSESSKGWAVILLLASLNLQHLNLKEELGNIRIDVRTIEMFLSKDFGFKTTKENI